MKRILLASVAIAACTGVLLAASPAVDGAIKTLQAVGADAGKLKLFCELNKLAGDEKEDAAVEKQIEEIAAKIGPDFVIAWRLGEGLDEETPDGKEFFAAVEAIAGKCT